MPPTENVLVTLTIALVTFKPNQLVERVREVFSSVLVQITLVV